MKKQGGMVKVLLLVTAISTIICMQTFSPLDVYKTSWLFVYTLQMSTEDVRKNSYLLLFHRVGRQGGLS